MTDTLNEVLNQDNIDVQIEYPSAIKNTQSNFYILFLQEILNGIKTKEKILFIYKQENT